MFIRIVNLLIFHSVFLHHYAVAIILLENGLKRTILSFIAITSSSEKCVIVTGLILTEIKKEKLSLILG